MDGMTDNHDEPARRSEPRPRRGSSSATATRSRRRCGAVRLRQRHAGSRPGQDRREHGRRRGGSRREADRRRRPRPDAITGQKPLVTTARKSIAQFKLREGMPIGANVTLRGDRMWEFLDRLLSLALPRIRDFRGLSAAPVRRSRQLHVRSHRAVDVPRDRPGHDRSRPRYGHHGRHHGEHATTRDARCFAARLPVQRRS